jgi:TRAP-type C4-dicarboxylate transport system substrate-binding protein
MLKKASVLSVIFFVLLIQGILLSATAAEPIELTFAHFVPPQHAQGGVIDAWAKDVSTQSNGGLKIKVSHSAQMGNPLELYSMVKQGIIDIVYIPHSYAPKGTFPLSTFIQLPFFTKSAEKGTLLFWQVYKRYLLEEHKDVKVLWVFANPPSQINCKKPIKTVDDLKGLTFGTTGSEIVNDTMRHLGAKAIDTSVNEMTKLAEKGVIDGVPLPFEVLPPFGAHTQFKYHSIVYLNHEPMLVAMNKKVYESLPSDMKQLIDKNSGIDMAMKAGTAFDQTEKMMKEICLKEGGKEYIVPDNELKKWSELTKPIGIKWVNDMQKQGLPGAAVLEYAIEVLLQIQE